MTDQPLPAPAATATTPRRVSYIFPISHHYRRPFHERLRVLLAAHNVDYKVVYCAPGEENRKKNDTVEIEWGVKVPLTNLVGGLQYQHALGEALKSDLVIIQQENKHFLNYVLNILSMLGLKRVAYFGHGKNFQSRSPDSRAERFKRFWATKVNWWFGYTEATKQHVASLGFDPARITVFNNAVDTSTVARQVAEVTDDQLAALRSSMGLVGTHVGVFVGGLYPDKRLAFLVEAAERIRTRLPDFELIVVGGGVDFATIADLAASRPWLHVTGPRFGIDKVALMRLGHVFMMPGLVGLAILDAAMAGLPLMTTTFPWHSPEIAYLDSGVNGLMVADWENAAAYADAVADLLSDPPRLAAMRAQAEALGRTHTIENMAERFAEGVLKALDTPR